MDRKRRRRTFESLERRVLLAGDVITPESTKNFNLDVNRDGGVTAIDALAIINYMSREGESEQILTTQDTSSYDVNVDQFVTAADALTVINALGSPEEVGELIELLLTARDQDDEPLPLDSEGQLNVAVGQHFDLEVSYRDFRLFDHLGAFQLLVDMAPSQPGVLSPVLNETQIFTVSKELGIIDFSAIEFRSEDSLETFQSSRLSFLQDPIREIQNALFSFGFTEADTRITSLNNDHLHAFQYTVHWVGDQFGNVDLPDLSMHVLGANEPVAALTQTDEYAPFLSDGTTPNPAAVRFNLDRRSRTFNQNEEYFTFNNRGTFDSESGFQNVGGTGQIPVDGLGVRSTTDDGRFINPFDAFSVRVFVNQPVTGLVIDMGPSDDIESTLLYGLDVVVPPDLVLTRPESSTLTTNAEYEGTYEPISESPVRANLTSRDATSQLDLLQTTLDFDTAREDLRVRIDKVGGDAEGITIDGADVTINPSVYQSRAPGNVSLVTINFTVLDDQGHGVPNFATIRVNNHAPLEVGPAPVFEFAEDDVLQTLDLIGTSRDPEGSVLQVDNLTTIEGDSSGVAGLSAGHLNVRPWAYQYLGNEQETIRISYDLVADSGVTDHQTATIIVQGINSPPQPDRNNGIFRLDLEPQTVNVLEFASAGLGEDQTLRLISVQANDERVAVSFDPDGTIVVTPRFGFSGSFGVDYQIEDSQGASAAATLTATFLPSYAPSVQGSVRCKDELVSGAFVYADLNLDGKHSSDEPSTSTDQNGYYQLLLLPNGDQQISAIVPDHCQPVSETAATEMAMDGWARDLIAVDFDADGDQDVVTVNDLANTVTFLRNEKRQLSHDRTVEISSRPVAIDSWQSPSGESTIAIAAVGQTLPSQTPDKGVVIVMHGDTTRRVPMGNGPVDVVVDDFNQDGIADIAAVSLRSFDAHLQLSGGESMRIARLPVTPIAITSGDFNGDGLRDLALAGHGDGASHVRVLAGNGRGGFSATPVSTSSQRIVAIESADLDGDGNDELLVTGYGGDLVVLGLDGNRMREVHSLETESGASQLLVGDLDQDGQPDVAMIHSGSGRISLWHGDGAGTLTPVSDIDAQGNAEIDGQGFGLGGYFHANFSGSMAAIDAVFADFDGDGIREIALAGLDMNDVDGPTTKVMLLGRSTTVSETVPVEREVTRVIDFEM